MWNTSWILELSFTGSHPQTFFFFLWSTVIYIILFFRGWLLLRSWLYSIDIASHGKFLAVANSVSSLQRRLECAILQTDPKSQAFLDNSILTAHYALSDTIGSESYVLHVIQSPIIRWSHLVLHILLLFARTYQLLLLDRLVGCLL